MRPVALLLCALAAAVVLIGYLLTDDAQDGQSRTETSTAPAPGTDDERPRTPTLAGQRGLTPRRETAGVRSGIAVYTDIRGTGANVRSIPFGERVTVVCVAPNESGITSINAFYLLSTPPWRGLFASANQFLNGARLGETTNAFPVNPDVSVCRPP